MEGIPTTNNAEIEKEENEMGTGETQELSRETVFHVKVDRGRSPRKAIEAAGTVAAGTLDSVVASMSQGKGNEVEVVFFPMWGHFSEDELIKEYEKHGLNPADPYSLAAVVESNPHYPHDSQTDSLITFWKDGDSKWGKWCILSVFEVSGMNFLQADRWKELGGTGVHVYKFAGIRK